MVLEHRGAHTSRRLTGPDGGAPVHLPAHSPELTPGERWCQEVRAPLANPVPDRLEGVETALTKALHQSWRTPRPWSS
jgi:hypothetical protein